ncbi:MAG: NAD(P)/FAD-dependent oxidoreductase [Pirellulaceae bacterium]|nr:NAD(P)/FAD-dependent oxidoreductase [Planctomycetales bacterium]
MNRPTQQTAVIGGGMLGMTIALRLAQAGHRVTLLEAADQLGGLAAPWQLGSIRWDRFYHVTLLSDAHLLALLEELKLHDQLQWSETKTGFYTDGQWYSMSNLLEFLRFPPLRMVDKLRLGTTIFWASKIRNWQRLERVMVADWLRRWSGQATFTKIWLPLLRAKLGDNYRHCSAAFIWATIARMYAARRTGLKKEMFGYVQGGYARVIERFAEELAAHDVSVLCGVQVTSVRSGGEQTWVESEGRQTLGFDRVVLTVPPARVAELCPQLSPDESQRMRNIRYQGIVCASLLLPAPVSPYYVTNITEHDTPFTAIIEMTSLVSPEAFGGKTLLYLPKYLPAESDEFLRSDESFRDQFYAGLRRMVPSFSPEDVVAFRIARVRQVMPIPTRNYSSSVPPMQTSVPGVFAVNSSHIVNGTLNVNETVRLANDASGIITRLTASPQQAKTNSDREKANDQTSCQLVPGP